MIGDPEGLDSLRVDLLTRGIRLGARIGGGAAATVYEGDDEKHQRRVAIKILDPIGDASVTSERFIREVGLIAGFQHPHILPLYDSGEVKGLQYYIMPYAVGESLRSHLERNGPLPLEMAVRLGIEIADALGYAHHRGVVHRDVKPANILFDGGHFQLADFGIAAVAPKPGRTPGGPLTGQGGFVGTLGYMAPEQILGESVDGRTDIYSLASVVYEAISGLRPFLATNPSRETQEKLAGTHQSLAAVVTGLPIGLAELLDRSLAANPSARPASAGEFQAELEAFRLPADKAVRRRTGSRPHPRRVGLIGVILLVVTAALWRTFSAPRLDFRRVVVAGFTNETGNPALVPFGDQIETWITDGLAQIGSIRVISAAVELPIRRPQGVSGPETPQERLAELARETRAGTVVAGSFFERGDQLEVSVEVTDAQSGEVRSAIGPIRGTRANSERLAETVGRLVVHAVDSLLGQPRGP